ncbi:MAG: hypothetical protein HY053_05210 [Proteobacteria bacterium]|nr:hypothetical protein [Pseudomonadota bacterium]
MATFLKSIDKEAAQITRTRLRHAGSGLELVDGEKPVAPFTYGLDLRKIEEGVGSEIEAYKKGGDRGVALAFYKKALTSLSSSYPKRIAHLSNTVIRVSGAGGAVFGAGTAYSIGGIAFGGATLVTVGVAGVVGAFAVAASMLCYRAVLQWNAKKVEAHAEDVTKLLDLAAAYGTGTQILGELKNLKTNWIVRSKAQSYRYLLQSRIKQIFSPQLGVTRATMQILPGLQPA